MPWPERPRGGGRQSGWYPVLWPWIRPRALNAIDVVTCEQMADKMIEFLEDADIIIKVAAVADYRPEEARALKMKKKDQTGDVSIPLVENPDILKKIGGLKSDKQFLVGFAAETHDLKQNALLKIQKKNLDMIAANLVGQPGSGFQADTNKLKLFSKDGSVQSIPLMEKLSVADALLDHILIKLGS